MSKIGVVLKQPGRVVIDDLLPKTSSTIGLCEQHMSLYKRSTVSVVIWTGALMPYYLM